MWQSETRGTVQTLVLTFNYIFLRQIHIYIWQKRDHQSKQSTASSASSPSPAKTGVRAADLRRVIKVHRCTFKCNSYPLTLDKSDIFASPPQEQELGLMVRSLIVSLTK